MQCTVCGVAAAAGERYRGGASRDDASTVVQGENRAVWWQHGLQNG
jgi:hypothetical protein